MRKRRKNMISVENFIEGYNQAKNKSTYVLGHVVNKYVNYEEKMAKCKKNVLLSMYKVINDKKVYFVNTPQQYLLYCLEIIASYTDIDMGTEEEVMKNFNEMNKINLIDIILSSVPETEIMEFKTILEMTVSDERENMRSLPSFIDTKLEAINLSADTVLSAIEEISKNTKLDKNNSITNFTEV